MVREKHLCSTSLAADRSKLDHHEAEYAVKKAELDEMIQTHQQEMNHMRNLYAKFEETVRGKESNMDDGLCCAALCTALLCSSCVPCPQSHLMSSHF